MKIIPQQLDFPSLAFPKDRTALTVGEVAERWRVSDQHIVDLILEGKIAAFDIAGVSDYVRVPVSFIDDVASRLGISPETLRGQITAASRQPSGRKAFWRIPVEGYAAFLRENHSFAATGK